MLLMLLRVFAVNFRATLAKLLTWLEAPDQEYEVCQAMVVPLSESTPVH